MKLTYLTYNDCHQPEGPGRNRVGSAKYVGGLLMLRFSGNVAAYAACGENENGMGFFEPTGVAWVTEYQDGAFGVPPRVTLGPTLLSRGRIQSCTLPAGRISLSAGVML